MKLITFYSESHSNLYQIFYESYKTFLFQIPLKVKKIDQLSPTGEFSSLGFDKTMMEKIDWIIENIDVNSQEYLIFSDCDVQFFGDISVDMQDKDILFQDDYGMWDFSWFPDGKQGKSKFPNYCAGFFICKQSEKVKKFFYDVKRNFTNHMNGYLHDQTIINKMISEGYDINHGKLNSDKFWTVAFSINGNIWNGQDISVPKSILVHHANYTVGIENKIKLLNLVKEKLKN
jgi:hypothetical protein